MKSQALPCNIDVERMVLGSLVLDDSHAATVFAALAKEDFSMEKHRRIFRRMADLYERGERIDRVTIANELMRQGELESCDGLSYLVSLDDGLPQIPNLDSYVQILQEKATLRRAILEAQRTIQACLAESAESSQILAASSQALLNLSQDTLQSSFLSPTAIMAEAGGISTYLDRRNRTTGLESGFTRLDAMCGGFSPGKLYILGARPSIGKTAFALNVADRVAFSQDEGEVLIFSLEMAKEEILDRMICARARVDTQRFSQGYLNKDERVRVSRAVTDLHEHPRILVDDKGNIDFREMHVKIRQRQRQSKVLLVIVDYLQLLLSGEEKYRVAEMSKISRWVKLIAKDCKVPILALSQVSRDCDRRPDHRPKLSDLRESGSLEQDADLVAFLFREEVYLRDREDLRGVAELIVAKQRSGPTGIVPLVWQSHCVRFDERTLDNPVLPG